MTAITNSKQTNTSGRGNGLLYLLVGTGIGAATALLFAPKAGSELRHDISDVAHRGYDKTAELAGRVKDQSIDLYNTAREKAVAILDLTGSHAGELVDKAQEVAGGVSLELAEGVERLEKKFGGRQGNSSGSGRRSSSIV